MMARDGFISLSVQKRLLASARTPWVPTAASVGEFRCTACHMGFQIGESRVVQYENQQLRQYRCPACKQEEGNDKHATR